MQEVILLLGSNIGNRSSYLGKAVSALEQEVGKLVLVSSIYETASWGDEAQAPYLNQAVCLLSTLPPEGILKVILRIEEGLDRKRTAKWEPRTIDIDILFYGNEIIETDELRVPHIHLPSRRFGLVPLNEIRPDLRHPRLNKRVSELLKECQDNLEVKVYEP